MMKFQEGDSVEVLKREEEEPYGSWFPSKVIAVSGDYYVIRYDLLKDCVGKPLKEKVHEKDVRPWPTLKRRRRWVVGDVAEVFDVKSWRVGKIMKVLKNNLFVVRLFGSIQLKEFHESNFRIQQAWLKNSWSVIGKVDKESTKKLKQNKSKLSDKLACNSPVQVEGKDSCIRMRKRYINDKQNRSNTVTNCIERSFKDARSCMRGYEDPFFMQVHENSLPATSTDCKFDEQSREIRTDIPKTADGQTANDIDKCSVASCSSNDFAVSLGPNCNKALANASDNSDAESLFPSSSIHERWTPSFEQKFEADIHELEFQAYKSTVEALYASGPLSWEQESLLTNLRLSLHISDDEHLLQLRHLLSTQVV